MVSVAEATGRKVATVSGNYAGELSDVHIDPTTGKITQYEMTGSAVQACTNGFTDYGAFGVGAEQAGGMGVTGMMTSREFQRKGRVVMGMEPGRNASEASMAMAFLLLLGVISYRVVGAVTGLVRHGLLALLVG